MVLRLEQERVGHQDGELADGGAGRDEVGLRLLRDLQLAQQPLGRIHHRVEHVRVSHAQLLRVRVRVRVRLGVRVLLTATGRVGDRVRVRGGVAGPLGTSSQ